MDNIAYEQHYMADIQKTINDRITTLAADEIAVLNVHVKICDDKSYIVIMECEDLACVCVDEF